MATTLVLADDHPIILEGLEQLFRRDKEFKVLATCTNGNDAIAAIRKERPDIVVLDVRMPNGDGLSVLKTIHDEHLPSRVILLTASMEDDQVLDAMEQGVWGLVLKESAAVSLVDSVRKVSRGERALDQTLIVRALDRALERKNGLRHAAEVLSRREVEIVKMVAAGLRNKEIAAKLFIGEGTVKTHLHAIYKKLGVHGRVELTLYARERGIA
ncbi:MAG TPA: response regulator transcription factor [Thermoanaerobaculia bacterium]|nr:response regulator transcription factor [Thermoanaerobaculia bacterium]